MLMQVFFCVTLRLILLASLRRRSQDAAREREKSCSPAARTIRGCRREREASQSHAQKRCELLDIVLSGRHL